MKVNARRVFAALCNSHIMSLSAGQVSSSWPRSITQVSEVLQQNDCYEKQHLCLKLQLFYQLKLKKARQRRASFRFGLRIQDVCTLFYNITKKLNERVKAKSKEKGRIFFLSDSRKHQSVWLFRHKLAGCSMFTRFDAAEKKHSLSTYTLRNNNS